jgi:N-acetylneuraminic acid mutarotase
MVVWGGYDFPPPSFTRVDFNTGGSYDPSTDSWTPTSTVGAPYPRGEHDAVWTGSQMLIWGGTNRLFSPALLSGGRYDPATNSWATMSVASGGPPINGYRGRAVWTGSRMLVWGGGFQDSTSPIVLSNLGVAYDPTTDTWSPITTTGAPSARYHHTVVWTGREMVVWGGYGTNWPNLLNSGGRYEPVSGIWTPTSSVSAPAGTASHAAVWTDNGMLVWGGFSLSTNVGRYTLVFAHRDADGDGFGDPAVGSCDSVPPAGFVQNSGDCNDSNPAIHPGATDVCNLVDDDCDGAVDEDAGTGDPDGDQVLGTCDNCPSVPNPTQTNGDGDAAGDACDCAPTDPSNSAPTEVAGLTLSGDKQTLQWTAAANTARYDLLIGNVSSLPVGSGIENCYNNLTTATASDPTLPGVNEAFFYLVRAENDCLANQGKGSWGNQHDNPGPPGNGLPRQTTSCP